MLCICSDIDKLINSENTFKKLFFNCFPCDWQQLSSLLEPTAKMKTMEFEQK